MSFISIVYYFGSIFIGSGSLIISFLFMNVSKDKILFNYFLFYLSFTFFSLVNIGLKILSIFSHAYLMSKILFFSLINSFAFIVLMFFIVYFSNFMIAPPFKKKINYITGIISVIIFLVTGINLVLALIYQINSLNFILYVFYIVFAAVNVYSILLYLFFNKTLDKDKKKLSRQITISLLIFFPGILADLFLTELLGFMFFPLLYSAFSIIFLIYVKNYFFGHNQFTEQENKNILPDLNFSNLNDREKKVVIKIFEGLSYKEISSELSLPISTIKNDIHLIFVKTNTTNRWELLRFLSGK